MSETELWPSRPLMRLPDFVIIGTMKSGTTTLYRWLTQQSECVAAAQKEPNFFSHDATWNRGADWYSELFVAAGEERLTGEASVSYTDPRFARVAAARMRQTVPDARLICVLRHPLERVRSHYRHEVQRGREKRGFLESVAGEENRYTASSRYASCLLPWVTTFPREQLCVIRMEDLTGDDQGAWTEVLAHLHLSGRSRPKDVLNVTAEKEQFTWAMRFLWERGLLPANARLPRWLRQWGKRLLLRRSSSYEARLREAEAPIPDRIADPIWQDVARLPELLGDQRLRW